MATATSARPPAQSSGGDLLLPGASWADYEAMLRIVGDRRVRVTYDGSASVNTGDHQTAPVPD